MGTGTIHAARFSLSLSLFYFYTVDSLFHRRLCDNGLDESARETLKDAAANGEETRTAVAEETGHGVPLQRPGKRNRVSRKFEK